MLQCLLHLLGKDESSFVLIDDVKIFFDMLCVFIREEFYKNMQDPFPKDCSLFVSTNSSHQIIGDLHLFIFKDPEPWVIESLCHCVSFLWICDEAMLYQILGVHCDISPVLRREAYMSIADLSDQIPCILACEGKVSDEDHIEHNSQGPDVTLLSILAV